MNHSWADSRWAGSLVWFLFLGSAAAGSYTLATLAAIFGRESDRKARRALSRLPLPLVVVCALVGLNMGGWRTRSEMAAVAAFSGFCIFAFLDKGAEIGRVLFWYRYVFYASGLAAAALFVAFSARFLPTTWIGQAAGLAMLFATSATTGAAASVLIVRCRCGEEDDGAIVRLGQVNAIANVIELAVLATVALTLRSPHGLAFMRWPGMLIPLFVVPIGLVLPLIIRQVRGVHGAVDSALLVLLGGFVLRLAVVGMPASLILTHR